jgi:signal transduction histidine kinase
MSATAVGLDARLADALRGHLERGDEQTLHHAYEIARRAVEEGLGLVDMASMLLRAWRSAGASRAAQAFAGSSPADPQADGWQASDALERFEAFALECFSPFEMEYRGARDATLALRRINERGEENVRRIAYELHDTAGQLLATVHFALDAAERRLGPASGNALVPVRTRLEEVELELRRLSHELRPTLLDHLGLVPALRELAQGVTKRSGLAIQVHDATNGRLPATVETALYRIAQEAFTNATRHSRATRVEVRVAHELSGVHCTITDNGVGFERATLEGSRPGPGLGLAGMAERLSPLGGSLRIETSPGRGVRLDIHIPLEGSHANTDLAGG